MEGIYREDGVKIPSALTSDTRGNGHKLQLGWSHREKHLQKGGAALGHITWLKGIIFEGLQYLAKQSHDQPGKSPTQYSVGLQLCTRCLQSTFGVQDQHIRERQWET